MTELPTMTTTSRYLSAAQTAKLVREQLRANFPGVKFSVRTDTYAGGASIDVRWTDGPHTAAVEAVVDRYGSRRFDGRDDSTHYRGDTLVAWADGSVEAVHFGAHYVMCHRELSAQYLDYLEPFAQALVAANTSTAWDRDGMYDTLFGEQYGYLPGYSSGHNVLWFLSQHVAAPASPAPAAKASRKRAE